MLRVFGFAARFAFAVCVVVVVAFGAVVVVVEAAGVAVFAGGVTVPGARVDPVVLGLLVPGKADVVGVVAGSSVIGVGTGGNGFDNTAAIISDNPLSEPAFRNL